MKTLAVNHDNDIYTINGSLAISSGSKCHAGIIESMIKTQIGELQFDEDVGIDYAGTVMQNQAYISAWASEVQTKVKKFSFVKEIKTFDYKYHSEDGRLEWSMLLVNTDEEEFSVGSSRDMKNGSVLSISSKWSAVEGKPEGLDTAIETIEKMREKAGDYPFMSSTSTLGDAKEVINDVAISQLSSIDS